MKTMQDTGDQVIAGNNNILINLISFQNSSLPQMVETWHVVDGLPKEGF